MRDEITISVRTDRDISTAEFARGFIDGLSALDDGRLAPEYFSAYDPVNRAFAIEGIEPAVKIWCEGEITMTRRQSPKMLVMINAGPPEALKYKRFPFWCSFSLCSTKLEAEASMLLRFLVEKVNPVFGRAALDSDFTAKHYFEIRESDGRLERYVGVEPGTQIPGIYWLTYLGPWAIEMIGRDKIETLPVGEVERIREGYIIKAYPHIKQAGSPEARVAEEAIKGHLGQAHFFDRSQVDIEKLKNPPHVEKAIREAIEKMQAEGKKSASFEI